MTGWKSSNKNAAYGFTMVELLVSIALFGLLGIISMRVFSHMTQGQQKFSQQAILQMETRRAFDQIFKEVRAGAEIIRPATGETLPYFVYKDLINHIIILYLEPDSEESAKHKRPVYNLISLRSDLSGAYSSDRERVLHGSIKELRFSSLSPGSVQVNTTVIGAGGEYQFLSHLGLLNVGGLQ